MYKSIQSQIKSLKKLSEKVADEFDQDIIHTLRTRFKKLRALLRWQKVNKKIYAPFKKHYNAAGEIRTIKIAEEMLEKEKDIPQAFKNWLSLQSAENKKKWNKTYDKKVLGQLEQKLENIRLRSKKNKKFFNSRIKEIQKIISKNAVPDDSLHDMRKMIKDMQYVLEWHENKSNTKIVINNITVYQLKNIGKQIGAYNDIRMLLALFIMFTKQENQKTIIDDLSSVIDKWQQKKVMQKEKLISKLHGIKWQPD